MGALRASVLDANGVAIAVTGSSAALLSREVGTALRGRAWSVPLFPFSFAEMLAREGVDIPDIKRTSPETRGAVENVFLRWLDVGDFPEAQDLDLASRRQLLRDYVDVAMLRDVVERNDVSNITGRLEAARSRRAIPEFSRPQPPRRRAGTPSSIPRTLMSSSMSGQRMPVPSAMSSQR